MQLQSPPFWWLMTNWLKFSTGIKVCESSILCGLSSYIKRGPPEDVHIDSLLLNANAHGRFCFVESIFKVWRQFIMHINGNEDNDMHNGKWTSAEWLHAEFITASQSSSKSSTRLSSLSVTTQKPNSFKTGVEKLSKNNATTPYGPAWILSTSYASPPFVSKDQKGLKT